MTALQSVVSMFPCLPSPAHEDAVPLAEHEVAGDHERAAFVALGHEGEEDLGFVGVCCT